MTDEIPTSERLAQAIEAIDNPKLQPIADRARAKYYDEFSGKLEMPLCQLIIDLRAIGDCDELIQRIMQDEFCASEEEIDAWMSRTGISLLTDDPATAIALGFLPKL